jgi:hypothetical protein
MKAEPRVSIAIAVYNEEAVLPELLRRTAAVLDQLPGVGMSSSWSMTEVQTIRGKSSKAPLHAILVSKPWRSRVTSATR